jgi:hypothetical protein
MLRIVPANAGTMADFHAKHGRPLSPHHRNFKLTSATIANVMAIK